MTTNAPPELVDLADWPQERTAAYAAILDTHLLRPGTDLCGICEVKTPCPLRMDAESQLYRIGYLRGTLQQSSLRDLADYARWLKEEIGRREQHAADYSDDRERMLVGLPDLRGHVVATQAKLLEAAQAAYPDLLDQLPTSPAAGR